MPSARRGPCELEREERHRSILPPRERTAPDSLVRGSPGKQNQEEIDIQWSLNLFSFSSSSFKKMTVSSYRFYTQRSIRIALTQTKFTAVSDTARSMWAQTDITRKQ